MKRLLYFILLMLCFSASSAAQELKAKVSINSQKISNSKGKEIFDDLQKRLQDFINENKWTELQFREEERIDCSFNITINKTKLALGDVTVTTPASLRPPCS